MKILIFLCVCLIPKILFAVDFELNQSDGLFEIKNNDGVFLNSKYIGWGPNWKWDAAKTFFTKSNDNNKELTINFRQQNIVSKVKIKNTIKNIKYFYEHEFKKHLINTIGAGIEFNLDLRSQIQKYSAKQPYLLPNNTGWAWEFETGEIIKVEFTHPVSKVYFEKGNKNKIRVLFFQGEINEGKSSTLMTITLPKDLSIFSFNNTNEQSLRPSSWLENALDPLDTFIDLSYLNDKPAGKHGFVKPYGDKFIFEDKSPARFYGTNVQAYSIFINNKKLIKQHAKRIAKLGFNLVRLHHHDSIWVKSSLIKKGLTTQKINLNSLDNYFWWVKCLKDEGVYIWVDLQVQRPWRKGDDIPGWSTDMERHNKKGMTVGKGFIYLNEKMQFLTKKFNQEFLTTINPYTQLALKDDPAVMGVMITNENDITHHFGNAFLKNKGHPYHVALFENKLKQFSNKFGLSSLKLRETWKPGISKYLLNDIEADFNKNMISHLRSIGLKVPISTTSLWGKTPSLFSLPALTVGGMIDAHGYQGRSKFKKNLLQKHPHFSYNFLHTIGQGQIVDKPFTVTEYNVGARNFLDDNYIPMISMASMASFQGWDAIMLYGYSQDGFRGKKISPWSSYNNPTIIGLAPAMALLYRENHVAEAKKSFVLTPTEDEMFTKALSPKTSMTIRTLLEQHKISITMPITEILPWLKPSIIPKNVTRIKDFNKNMLSDNQNYVVSDTGEMRRNWAEGILTINTSKTQLAMGRIGEKTLKLKDVAIKSSTKNAAIIFTSLDRLPINSSAKILVSAVAKIKKNKNKRRRNYLSEAVNADIIFSSKLKGLKTYALLPDGSKGNELKMKINNKGDYLFSLSDIDKSHWYIITK